MIVSLALLSFQQGQLLMYSLDSTIEDPSSSAVMSSARTRTSALTPAKANGTKIPPLGETPSRQGFAKLLEQKMESQKKVLFRQMEENKEEIKSQVKGGVREIRTDTTSIKSTTKTIDRRLVNVEGSVNDVMTELQDTKALVMKLVASNSQNSSSSRPMPIDTIITRDSLFESESISTDQSNLNLSNLSNNRVGKQHMQIQLDKRLLCCDDDSTVGTTPEKNKLKDENKKHVEKITLLEKQLTERDQEVKSLKENQAVFEAIRNEQAVKPSSQPLTKRTEASAAAHVQRARDGRSKKRKNASALDKRLPPAFRDHGD